jgi:ribose transport system substrate-binding protein
MRNLIAAVAIVALAGCQGSSTAPLPSEQSAAESTAAASPAALQPRPGSKGTVGVSVLTLTNPFFKVIGDNITQELAKANYDTVVVSGDMDVATQQRQVRDFIVAKVSAIVLCPCDSQQIGPVIKEANEAGIAVFTADLACLAPGIKVVSHIATDNLGGGRLAGEAMIEALGEAGGKIAILDFAAAESCMLRVKGFREVIDQHNAERTSGKIQIVKHLEGGGAREQGSKAAEDALTAHPDLAGIFAINDPSALGARAALERAGKADQVKIIGFDGQKEGKEAIRDGKIFADPIQYPDQIGIKTAQSILAYFQGEDVPPEQLIPTSLYRQAQAQADPELRSSAAAK